MSHATIAVSVLDVFAPPLPVTFVAGNYRLP